MSRKSTEQQNKRTEKNLTEITSLDRVMEKIALLNISANKELYTLKVAQINSALKKKGEKTLTTPEKRAWAKYRARNSQNKKREEQVAAAIIRNNSKIKAKEDNSNIISLLNLSNINLVSTITELYIYNMKNVENRSTRNQLLFTTNNHTYQELKQIQNQLDLADKRKILQKTIEQIKETLSNKVGDEYKEKKDKSRITTKEIISIIDEAIQFFYDQIKIIELLERESKQLHQLNDSDLRVELVDLFESAKKLNWLKLFEKILFQKLIDIGNSSDISRLNKRITNFSVDDELFTDQVKKMSLETINYFIKNQ